MTTQVLRVPLLLFFYYLMRIDYEFEKLYILFKNKEAVLCSDSPSGESRQVERFKSKRLVSPPHSGCVSILCHDSWQAVTEKPSYQMIHPEFLPQAQVTKAYPTPMRKCGP